MQIIENALVQVAVDEDGACLTHLLSRKDQFDYLLSADTAYQTQVAFPEKKGKANLALELPWTVVDKGDQQVSLTQLSNKESYGRFPYHFEVMVTYLLEGNQLKLTFLVKNQSHKIMPFELRYGWPRFASWQVQGGNGQVELARPKHVLKLTSSDFNFKTKATSLIEATDTMRLAAGKSQKLHLTVTIG